MTISGNHTGYHRLLPAAEIAGIPIPRTEYAQIAWNTCTEVSEQFLANHCVRTYLFGCAIGISQRISVDQEVFFIACILHDLGLTSTFAGPLPFEIESARHAKAILLKAGFSEAKAEIVWDGIAMHTQTIADFKRPEIMLVSAGAAMDVTGAGIDVIARSHVDEIVTAFPRLGMKDRFIGQCAEIVQRFPAGSTRSFMRDIGTRKVQNYEPSNICDRILSSPFDE